MAHRRPSIAYKYPAEVCTDLTGDAILQGAGLPACNMPKDVSRALCYREGPLGRWRLTCPVCLILHLDGGDMPVVTKVVPGGPDQEVDLQSTIVGLTGKPKRDLVVHILRFHNESYTREKDVAKKFPYLKRCYWSRAAFAAGATTRKRAYTSHERVIACRLKPRISAALGAISQKDNGAAHSLEALRCDKQKTAGRQPVRFAGQVLTSGRARKSTAPLSTFANGRRRVAPKHVCFKVSSNRRGKTQDKGKAAHQQNSRHPLMAPLQPLQGNTASRAAPPTDTNMGDATPSASRPYVQGDAAASADGAAADKTGGKTSNAESGQLHNQVSDKPGPNVSMSSAGHCSAGVVYDTGNAGNGFMEAEEAVARPVRSWSVTLSLPRSSEALGNVVRNILLLQSSSHQAIIHTRVHDVVDGLEAASIRQALCDCRRSSETQTPISVGIPSLWSLMDSQQQPIQGWRWRHGLDGILEVRLLLGAAKAANGASGARVIGGSGGAGLPSGKNLCFLNASLQCLSSLPDVQSAVLPLAHSWADRGDHPDGHNVEHRLKDVLYKLCSSSPGDIVDTSSLSCLIGTPSLCPDWQQGKQQDAAELMCALLQHQGMAKLCGGSEGSRVICQVPGCGHIGRSSNPFFMLPIGLADGDTVDELIHAHLFPELLEAGNVYNHDLCKARCPDERLPAIKESTLSNLRSIQILHLKRFNAAGDKLTGHVGFGMQLELPQGGRRPSDTFKLWSVLVQLGPTKERGHYVTYKLDSHGQWWRANDETVVAVTEKEVLGAQAYLLFYQRAEANKAERQSSRPAVPSSRAGDVPRAAPSTSSGRGASGTGTVSAPNASFDHQAKLALGRKLLEVRQQAAVAAARAEAADAKLAEAHAQIDALQTREAERVEAQALVAALQTRVGKAAARATASHGAATALAAQLQAATAHATALDVTAEAQAAQLQAASDRAAAFDGKAAALAAQLQAAKAKAQAEAAAAATHIDVLKAALKAWAVLYFDEARVVRAHSAAAQRPGGGKKGAAKTLAALEESLAAPTGRRQALLAALEAVREAEEGLKVVAPAPIDTAQPAGNPGPGDLVSPQAGGAAGAAAAAAPGAGLQLEAAAAVLCSLLKVGLPGAGDLEGLQAVGAAGAATEAELQLEAELAYVLHSLLAAGPAHAPPQGAQGRSKRARLG